MAVYVSGGSAPKNATTKVSYQVTRMRHKLAATNPPLHGALCLDCSSTVAVMQTISCSMQRLKKNWEQTVISLVTWDPCGSKFLRNAPFCRH